MNKLKKNLEKALGKPSIFIIKYQGSQYGEWLPEGWTIQYFKERSKEYFKDKPTTNTPLDIGIVTIKELLKNKSNTDLFAMQGVLVRMKHEFDKRKSHE